MSIRTRGLMVATIFGVLMPSPSFADPSTLTASAQELVACMKAFDAACILGMTDDRFFRELGVAKAQAIKAAEASFSESKSLNITYSRFDLGTPSEEFKLNGRTYAFLPYVSTMSAPGQGSLTFTAFFIGVSDDDGKTWAFIEGSTQTAESIKWFIPGYQDQPPMPPISRTRDENAPDPPKAP